MNRVNTRLEMWCCVCISWEDREKIDRCWKIFFHGLIWLKLYIFCNKTRASINYVKLDSNEISEKTFLRIPLGFLVELKDLNAASGPMVDRKVNMLLE